MKKYAVLFISLATLLMAWSCSEENSSPVGTSADATTIESDADFNFDLTTTATFELTLENLAPVTGDASSQILSPPVFAVHSKDVQIFNEGQLASNELYQVAEDAVNGPLVELLNGVDAVHDVTEGGDVIFPGASATYSIEAMSGKTHISLVSMLVNTNDAFAGLNNLKLNKFGSQTLDIYAYDAGSEENTELTSDIPGPCCGNPLVRVPTSDPIAVHGGIVGNGDLDPEVYGWSGPIARLTITRVE